MHLFQRRRSSEREKRALRFSPELPDTRETMETPAKEPGIEKGDEKKSLEQARQGIFQQGKVFLDAACERLVYRDAIWELGTGLSFNLNPQFAFVDGLWKVRWKVSDAWADPASRAPPSGKGEARTRAILDKLAALNASVGNQEFPNDVRVTRVECQGAPIALNTTKGSLTVIYTKDRVRVWLPGDGYFLAEIDGENYRKELTGSERRCDGGGPLVGGNNALVFAFRNGAGEATIAVWPPREISFAHVVNWPKEERERYEPQCYIKLIRREAPDRSSR